MHSTSESSTEFEWPSGVADDLVVYAEHLYFDSRPLGILDHAKARSGGSDRADNARMTEEGLTQNVLCISFLELGYDKEVSESGC